MDVRERFEGGLVLDGGLATELERRGADLRDELWSARLLIENPDLIRDVHLAYFEAGADVAITASYQASFEGFARRGLNARQGSALLRRSVDLAREAAAERRGTDPTAPAPLVAASIGPYGAALADGSEYVGNYGLGTDELIAFHRPRLEALLDGGPDVLAIETIPSIAEAEAIARLLEDYDGASAWVSFSCRDHERISDGTPIAEAARVAASSDRVLAVGVNCTPPGFVPDLLDATRSVTDRSLVAYPNLGSTWDAEARTWRAEGPRPDFGAESLRWRKAGATIIGGCCGTTPEDVAAIANAASV